MTKKLSERVREYEFDIPDAYGANRPYITVDTDKIASEIESLERQRDALLGALRPFANEAHRYDPDENDGHETPWSRLTKITIGDLRKARAAIAAAEGDK